MAEEARGLHFTQIHSSSLVKEGHQITFVGANGKGYSAVIDHSLVPRLIDVLQNRDAIQQGGSGSALLTLTLIGTQSLTGPKGKAIALRTQEWGTIALALNDQTIAFLRKELDRLDGQEGATDARH